MHRDKTVARIILILSVVHVAVTAPAIVRQRSLNVDDDVTPASEKRGGDTPQGLPQMPDELPTTSGVPPLQHSSPESGTPQLHNDPTPTSGAPPLQDDTSPAPGNPPSHNDRPLTSEETNHAPVLQWLKDMHPGEGASSWSWSDVNSEFASWPDNEAVASPPPHPPPPTLPPPPPPSQDPSPKSGTPQLHNEPPTTLGVLFSQDPSPESGTPQLHNDPTPTSGAPPLHEDTSPAPGDPPYHNDRPLTSEEINHAPVLQWLKDARPGEGAISWPHVEPEPIRWPYSEAVAPPPPPPKVTGNRVLSDEMKRKLLIFAGFGVFAGVTAGVGYAVHQIISYSHGAQPAGRNITSTNIVGRGVSTHTRPPVSRALANLRDEDLRLLSVLTRRALERLD